MYVKEIAGEFVTAATGAGERASEASMRVAVRSLALHTQRFAHTQVLRLDAFVTAQL